MTTNIPAKSDVVSDEEIRELVKARLLACPDGLRISVGSDGDFSAKELVSQVDEQTTIGQKVVEMQLSYLRALKEGLLLSCLDA